MSTAQETSNLQSQINELRKLIAQKPNKVDQLNCKIKRIHIPTDECLKEMGYAVLAGEYVKKEEKKSIDDDSLLYKVIAFIDVYKCDRDLMIDPVGIIMNFTDYSKINAEFNIEIDKSIGYSQLKTIECLKIYKSEDVKEGEFIIF